MSILEYSLEPRLLYFVKTFGGFLFLFGDFWMFAVCYAKDSWDEAIYTLHASGKIQRWLNFCCIGRRRLFIHWKVTKESEKQNGMFYNMLSCNELIIMIMIMQHPDHIMSCNDNYFATSLQFSNCNNYILQLCFNEINCFHCIKRSLVYFLQVTLWNWSRGFKLCLWNILCPHYHCVLLLVKLLQALNQSAQCCVFLLHLLLF